MNIQYILFSTFLFVFFACSPEPKTKEENLPTQEIETPKEEEEILEPKEPEPVEISDEELDAQIKANEEKELEKLLQKDSPTILDYYLALPHSYIFAGDCEAPKYMTMEYRKKEIHYQNLKAGYLKHSKHTDGQVFVLFKNRSENKDYIAHFRENQCGEFSCGAYQGFVTLDESGKWVNATEKLLEQNELTKKIWKNRGLNYYLKLPEQGTSIEIITCSGDTRIEEGLGKLIWQQTHFVAELNEAGKAYFE